MGELKTQKTTADVPKFLAGIADATVQRDALQMVTLMRGATRAEPAIWGSSIVGFGTYHYVYASGREGDWFQIGFAPRKKYLTLYLMGGLKAHASLLKKLGKHRVSGSCLHITNLDDVHVPTLKAIIKASVQWARSQNRKPTTR